MGKTYRHVKYDEDKDDTVDVQVEPVPTVDAQEPVNSYPDWTPENSRVITYAVGTNEFKGIFASNREAAKKHCKQTYGEIVEENYVPGRAFLRVRK